MMAFRSDHRRFALWAAAVLVVILPPWWLWGADLAAALLRPLVGLLLKATGVHGVIATADGWNVLTGLSLANGKGEFVLGVKQDTLRRFLLGFPLLLAFMAAPPRTDRPWSAVAAGALALTAVFLFSVITYVWGELAPLLNPSLSPAGQAPVVALAAEPLHPAIAQIVLLGRYSGMSVLPLLTAVLVWAATNPSGMRALGGAPVEDPH